MRLILLQYYHLALLAFCLILLHPHSAAAAGLNEGIIKVDSRSRITEHTKTALSQVFLKISGDPQVLSNDAVRRSISNYEQYLVSSRFFQRDQNLFFVAQFNQQKVISLLTSLSLPVWPETRPATILWLGYQDANEFYYTSQRSPDPYASVIDLVAMQRGIELFVPVGDLEDERLITGYDVWSQNLSKLQRASFRYPSENLLSISINNISKAQIIEHNEQIRQMQLAFASRQLEAQKPQEQGDINDLSNLDSDDDEVEIKGTLLQEIPEDVTIRVDVVIIDNSSSSGTQTSTAKHYGNDIEATIESIISDYSVNLARRFAVTKDADSGVSELTLKFQNIRSLKDIINVQTLLQNNPIVQSVNLREQSPDESVFLVTIVNTSQRLLEILLLDNRVSSVQSLDAVQSDTVVLRWEPL